MRLICN